MNFRNFFFALSLFIGFQSVSAQASWALYSNEDLAVEITAIGEETASGAEVVSAYQEGVALTKLYNKYGLVNAQGVEIIAPRYEEIRPFENGYAAIRKGNKWSFINKQGRKISSFRFDWVGRFEQAAAAVQINGKWGFINEQGALIVAAEFEAVRSFGQNGLAMVKKDGQWYNLNQKGELTALPSNLEQGLQASR